MGLFKLGRVLRCTPRDFKASWWCEAEMRDEKAISDSVSQEVFAVPAKSRFNRFSWNVPVFAEIYHLLYNVLFVVTA